MKKDRQNRFHPDDALEVHSNSTANRSLICYGSHCKSMFALRMSIDRPGSYFIVMQFNVTQEVHDMVQSFEFSGRTLNPDFAYLSVAVKCVLFLASLLNAVLFFRDLRVASLLRIEPVFEQTFLKYLNLALVMFFDPVNIYHSYRSTFFTYARSSTAPSGVSFGRRCSSARWCSSGW